MTPPVDADPRGVESLRHEIARRTGTTANGRVMDQIFTIAEERLAVQATALAASQARVEELERRVATARAEALEEAAKVVDEEALICFTSADRRDARTASGTAALTMEIGGQASAKHIAARIRALSPDAAS